MTDELDKGMEELDWVRLPVDADGEYIHAGDVLDGYGKTIEVVELRYGRSGWVLISRDGNGYADTFAFTHHHAPTVEDVLREFTDEVWNRCCEGATASDSGIDELVAECASRLRLADVTDSGTERRGRVMDVSGMTLEGFFLADYERMRERITELESDVKRLTSDGYGCIDLHETCDAVKVKAASTYDIRNMAKNGMGLDELRRAYEMTDDDLMTWASQPYRSTSYGSRTWPISIDYHKYQYTLRFNETRGCHTYVTDGEGNSELIEIDSMEDFMEDNLNNWCREEYLEKLKNTALTVLRKNIELVIKKLEKEQ